MPRALTINVAPYKSSNLAVPPSPFSPRLPITPIRTTPSRSSSPRNAKCKPELALPPPPANPLRWLWQCHLCNRVYSLGTTRRCLDDGHYFCAGTTTVKRSRRTNKKVVRHKACASEFDYQGWKAFGPWRRDVISQMEAAGLPDNDDVVFPLTVPSVPSEGEWLHGMWVKSSGAHKPVRSPFRKDCWGKCDYPSECRWGKQYGVHTPVASSAPPPPPKAQDEKPKTTFDDILLDVSRAPQSSAEHLEHTHEEIDITSLPTAESEAKDTAERRPSMTDLLESAKRRKRRSGGQVPSPLGSNPPSPTTAEASAESAPTTATGYLIKALDDFEIDFKKSSLLERAGGLVSGWASSIRSTAALEEEKADMFVKGLRVSKKK
ncbi:hypothetical protein LTR53_007245 [Teratosphaeriaceae sp. CCFEE 6253]|nr:hypothetical protein LTR53_007245 [Teratosphaeriaceae sp. CCFEE 6253]